MKVTTPIPLASSGAGRPLANENLSDLCRGMSLPGGLWRGADSDSDRGAVAAPVLLAAQLAEDALEGTIQVVVDAAVPALAHGQEDALFL